MHSVLERLVDSSLEGTTSNEPKIRQEVDAGTGKCVYGWQNGDDDSTLVLDFLDAFGGSGGNNQPQIPFHPNLAM